MKWRGRNRSQNVEDRRGQSSSGPGFSLPPGMFSGRRMPTGRGLQLGAGGGLGLVILLGLFLLFGGQGGLGSLFTGEGGLESGRRSAELGGGVEESQKERDRREMLEVVLYETEQFWTKAFSDLGRRYEPCTLVLFRRSVQTRCGGASSQVGPFYCSADQKVYIDLSFYDSLEKELGAGGDFAMAYVLAHEVGHHVQDELGILGKVHELKRGAASEKARNDLTVRMELQADYLAGVWARYAERQGMLDPGDIDEAMRATRKIGDDHLQRQAQGFVVPDSFTHGTSDQRSRWFRKGYEAGDLSESDTYSAERASELFHQSWPRDWVTTGRCHLGPDLPAAGGPARFAA